MAVALASTPLMCLNTCSLRSVICVDGGAAAGVAVSNTSTASKCGIGTQCRECGPRGMTYINESYEGARLASATSKVAAWVQHARSIIVDGSSDVDEEQALPGSCETLHGHGAALCCSSVDNSVSPWRGQPCVPVAHSTILGDGRGSRCRPSGAVLEALGHLPLSCGDLVSSARREVVARRSVERNETSSGSCASIPAPNAALCCAARDGSPHNAGQLCIPGAFSTGATCEAASWVVAYEPVRSASCAVMEGRACALPRGVGCNERRASSCCGYKDGRLSTVWSGVPCVPAMAGERFSDRGFSDDLGDGLVDGRQHDGEHGEGEFECQPATWVARCVHAACGLECMPRACHLPVTHQHLPYTYHLHATTCHLHATYLPHLHLTATCHTCLGATCRITQVSAVAGGVVSSTTAEPLFGGEGSARPHRCPHRELPRLLLIARHVRVAREALPRAHAGAAARHRSRCGLHLREPDRADFA